MFVPVKEWKKTEETHFGKSNHSEGNLESAESSIGSAQDADTEDTPSARSTKNARNHGRGSKLRKNKSISSSENERKRHDLHISALFRKIRGIP